MNSLTDADSGCLSRARYLIHGRDSLFTGSFRKILKSEGAETLKLPARSPDLNAYAERSVRSIESERRAKTIPLGERRLRKAVNPYTEQYQLEHNRQGLDNEWIEKPSERPDIDAAVWSWEVG